MPPARPPIRSVALRVGGLAAGLAGGTAFAAIPTPIPWLIGPLVFVAAANLAGLRIACPAGGRQLGQVLIGTGIGLHFTATVALLVAGQLPWMVMVALAAILMGGVGARIQRRVAGLDPATAFFGNVPGGMAEMIVIGDRFGADPVALTLSQTVRVGIVVITVPAGLAYLGTPGVEAFAPPPSTVVWTMLPVLLAATGAAAWALNRLGLTNAWMLGACGVAATLTVAGVTLSAMPHALSVCGQVLIGTALGQRFEREAMRRAPFVIIGAAASTLTLLVASIAIAFAVAALSGVPATTMVAAACPGGLAEMSITAQALGLGVPLVTAYHVTRVLMITLVTLPLFRLATRAPGRRAG